MSDHHPSPLPSCFRPPPSADDAAAAADRLPPPEAPAVSGNSNLTTSLYHTDLGIFTLTWSRCFLGRSLHLQLHPSAAANLSPLSLSNPLSLSTPAAFHLHIKPFVFWKRSGSKKLTVAGAPGGRDARVFWDLTRARFGSGPEPQHGFYVAVVVDGEMTLLVGDAQKEAYSKTRAKNAIKTQTLLLRREHVFGNKIYTTKASFGGKTREISIDCSVGDDPRLCFSVDRKRVLQIKRLKWKFRGNEKIEVDSVPIQVSWDVYNWLFDDVTDGHAVFMFRFENFGFEEEDDDLHHHNHNQHLNEKNGMVLCGLGMNGIERKKMKKSLLKTTRSSSSSSLSSASSGCSSSVMEWASTEEMELKSPSGFSLLVYAWKS